jgi:hypothetical protein
MRQKSQLNDSTTVKICNSQRFSLENNNEHFTMLQQQQDKGSKSGSKGQTTMKGSATFVNEPASEDMFGFDHRQTDGWKSEAGNSTQAREGKPLLTQLGHALGEELDSISRLSDDQQLASMKDDFNNTGLLTDQLPQMAELKGEDRSMAVTGNPIFPKLGKEQPHQ